MEELEKKLRKLYDDLIALSKSIEECEEEESDLVKDINKLIKEIERLVK